jgi:hypothetical protein
VHHLPVLSLVYCPSQALRANTLSYILVAEKKGTADNKDAQHDPARMLGISSIPIEHFLVLPPLIPHRRYSSPKLIDKDAVRPEEDVIGESYIPAPRTAVRSVRFSLAPGWFDNTCNKCRELKKIACAAMYSRALGMWECPSVLRRVCRVSGFATRDEDTKQVTEFTAHHFAAVHHLAVPPTLSAGPEQALLQGNTFFHE